MTISLDARLTRVSHFPTPRVGYHRAMLGGRIDRKAWAKEVADLIARFAPGPRPPGNKSAFARLIGMTTRTIDRWLACETDVSLDSVRTVADKLSLPEREQTELLTRIGYLSPGGFLAPPEIPNPHEDPIIQQIMADSGLTKEQRAELVDIQLDRIEADRDRRRDEYQRLRRLYDTRGDSGDKKAS